MENLKSQIGTSSLLVPPERIEGRILLIRGQKVMLDADLAELYGVTTKRLNEQVKRNRDRFPEDFVLVLSEERISNLEVAKCDLKLVGRQALQPPGLY